MGSSSSKPEPKPEPVKEDPKVKLLKNASQFTLRINDSELSTETTATSMLLKRVGFYVSGGNIVIGNVKMTILKAGTPVYEATASSKSDAGTGLIHKGVIIENDIEISIPTQPETESSTFKFCSAHIVKQEGATLLVLCFSRTFKDATSCIDRVLGGKTKLATKKQEGLSMATMGVVAKSFGILINPEFRDFRTGAKDAALGKIDQTNCALGTIRMIAVLFGRDPDTEVLREVARNRGKMLRFSRTDLAGLDEPIPCTIEDTIWDTIYEKTGSDGTKHCYQKRKTGLGQLFSRVPDHMVHTLPYRIIKRGPSEGSFLTMLPNSKVVTEEDKWLETSRGKKDKLDGVWGAII